MKTSEHIEQLLARYFADESLTPIQRVELEDWIKENRAEFNQIKHLLNKGTLHKSDIDFDTNKAWKKVEPKLSFKRKTFLTIYKIVSIAASVLLIIGITLWIHKDRTVNYHYANDTKQPSEVVLPDNSSVRVSPGGVIDYKAGKRRGNRQIAIKGKAFFDVKKLNGRAFIVEAYNTQIKVLGTSFLVEAKSPSQSTVRVKTGKVSVTNNKRNVILQANEQVYITASTMVKSLITDQMKAFEEIPSELKFHNTPIEKVVKQLESVFNVKIEIASEIRKNTITTIVKTDSLNKILTELSYLSKCKILQISDVHYKLSAE